MGDDSRRGGVQAEFDRKSDRHRRLVETPLPDGWLRTAMDAAFPGLPAHMTLGEAERRVTAAINSVLPLHELRVRNEIADHLRFGGTIRAI